MWSKVVTHVISQGRVCFACRCLMQQSVEPDPADELAELRKFLEGMKLGNHVDLLNDNGFGCGFVVWLWDRFCAEIGGLSLLFTTVQCTWHCTG